MPRYRSLFVALAWALSLCPAAVTAQRVGMYVGISYQSGEFDYGRGAHFGATLSLRPAARFGARFDLAYHDIGRANNIIINEPCGPTGCSRLTYAGNALHVVAATASVVLVERPGAHSSFYWTAGLGAYGVTESPHDGAYLRPGWHFGGGIRVGDAVSIELRYHQLMRPATLRHLIPITFGIRF